MDQQYVANSYKYPLDSHSSDHYQKYLMFSLVVISGIFILCCICAIFIGSSFIFYGASRYLRKYVTKRNGMYNKVNIESEIDQV